MELIGHVVAVLVCAMKWSITDAFTVNCTFDVFPFHLVGVAYRCAAVLSFDGDRGDRVTAVYGTHLIDKRNDDVQGLIISTQGMEFFPVNIESFFPNIKVLNFPLNSIAAVSNKHLIPFPKLEFLALYGNHITSLDSDLFQGLKSLKFINFGRNRIKHVGHDFILPATDAEIYLYSNVCIDEDAVTGLGVTYLRLSLMVNCPPKKTHKDTSLGSNHNTMKIKNKYLELKMRISFLDAIIDSTRCLNIEDPTVEITNKN